MPLNFLTIDSKRWTDNTFSGSRLIKAFIRIIELPPIVPSFAFLKTWVQAQTITTHYSILFDIKYIILPPDINFDNRFQNV